MRNLELFALVLFAFPCAFAAEPLSSASLIEEVISKTDHPRKYDWPNRSFEMNLGYAQVDEANNFETSGLQLEGILPLGEGLLLRAGVRYFSTSTTAAGRMLQQTPYSQAVQPTRLELLAGAAYPLMEGRSATRLSPTVTDLEHAFFVLAGVHRNVFSIPGQDETPLTPGMRAVKSPWVGEAGFRMQIYMPRSLGVYFEWQYNHAITGVDEDLSHWQTFAGGLSWGFGG